MKPRRDPLLFRGMMTALITPFRDDKVDFDALADLVDWQVGQGVQGLVACGTTAESPTLSHSEWTDVIGVCVQAAGGRVPVIAGSGVNDTRRTIELTNEAAHLGADAALVVTPSYSRPNQEGLFRHFESTRTHQCTDAHGKFTTRGATCTRFPLFVHHLIQSTGPLRAVSFDWGDAPAINEQSGSFVMASAIQPQNPHQRVNHFLVGRDSRGCWTVRDERNRVGGTFTSKDAAIRFARQESNTVRGAAPFEPEIRS